MFDTIMRLYAIALRPIAVWNDLFLVYQMYWIRSDSDSMSMEKHLYRGRVKGGGVFNLLPIPEVTIW